MIKTEKFPGRIRNRPLKDYTGQRFARLVALSFVERRNSGGSIWRFLCDCGTEKDISAKMVVSGHTSSCGCVAKEKLVDRNKKHGLSKSYKSTYRSWKDMRSRCGNVNDFDYADYGGRGIRVCEQWEDFAVFFRDMGARPNGKTLDRIDVNGNYRPENCRWADAKTQANNKRNNRLVEYQGQTRTLAQWCENFGIEQSKVKYRINAGWSLEDAFKLEDGRINGKNARHRYG